MRQQKVVYKYIINNKLKDMYFINMQIYINFRIPF